MSRRVYMQLLFVYSLTSLTFVVLPHIFFGFPFLNACCLCRSGVALGHRTCSRTVNFTLASSYFSPAPLFQWVLHKMFRIGFLKFPQVRTCLLPPLNYMPRCFIYNFVVRRHHFGWWAKYNCKMFHDEAIG